MHSLKNNRFTLIEVVLALAVVAIALAAILPLITVGLRATKDSIGDTYAADTAEQFLHYMAAKCKKDDTSWNKYIGTSDETGDFKKFKPTSEIDISAWPSSPISNTNFYEIATGTDKDVFGVKQGSGNIVDYSGTIRVWKSPVTSQTYSGSGWHEQTDSSYAHSAALNIEISWPVELPYNVRNKKYFYLEIFK